MNARITFIDCSWGKKKVLSNINAYFDFYSLFVVV